MFHSAGLHSHGTYCQDYPEVRRSILNHCTGTRCLAALIAVVLLAMGRPCPAAEAAAGGTAGIFPDEHISVEHAERAYRLVVPKSVNLKAPAPLVFAFHGLLDSKDLMPRYSQLDSLAEKQGFILVYPNSRGLHWPMVLEWAKQDLAFFDAIRAKIISQYNIDLRRVYLVGMSNGAYFVNLLASQRSDKIAAIALHSGGLGLVNPAKTKVGHKYPVMILHGTDDSIVPVGEGRRTRDAYKRAGYEVEYVEVPELNHFWAAGADANGRIWKFFLGHPLPAS